MKLRNICRLNKTQLGSLILAVFLLATAASCKVDAEPTAPNGDRDVSTFAAADGYEATETVTDLVNIAMSDGGHIVIELDGKEAPITVENFQKLVKEGFYDGTIFHRVIYGFMIQGGDPEGTGLGGSSQTIKGEFSANGVENDIAHDRGVISMARSTKNDSASSQFFIVHHDSPHLDGSYAAFGAVVYGIETVDQIASVATGTNNKPVEDVVMEHVFFVTKKG